MNRIGNIVVCEHCNTAMEPWKLQGHKLLECLPAAFKQIEALRAQRDALKEALVGLVNEVSDYAEEQLGDAGFGGEGYGEVDAELQRARAILDAVKEKP